MPGETMGFPAAKTLDEPSVRGAAETARAVHNAAVLGVALAGTWTIAVAIRLMLPRLLGPKVFGTLYFAEYFAATFFVLISLGVDNYIRKEIATRPAHASDFFGGLIAIRLAGGLVLVGAIAMVLTMLGRRGLAFELAIVFGAAQILVMTNLSWASLLQAVGEVRGLARLNVAAKIVWGAGIGGGLLVGLPVIVVPVSLFCAEALKTVGLAVLSRRHLGLKLNVDLRATFAVVVASLPWFVSGLARTVYDKVDVSMLAIMASDTEAGWYGAASTITNVCLLMLPLMVAVVLPSSSKAAAISEGELERFLDGTMRVTMTIAIPLALVFGLGADHWVVLLFGRPFAPAAMALKVLSAAFVFTYVATLASVHLYQLDRAWSVAWTSLAALAFNPAANAVLIPFGARHAGLGGAGQGAATASLCTEILAVLLMHFASGSHSIVRRGAPMLLRFLLAAVSVVLLDRLLVPIGGWRFLLDGTLYLALAFSLGLLRLADIERFFALVRQKGVTR